MKIAVYDFDGTIYRGDSTKDFFLFCLKRHHSICLGLPFFFVFLCLYFVSLGTLTNLKARFFSFLKRIADVDKEVALFWVGHENKVENWYLSQKKESDLIISASPEFLLKPLCEKLNIRLIASLVDKKTGLYTGLNCCGAEKLRRLNNEIPNVVVADFYSDSLDDSPMAQEAERAFFCTGSAIIPWQDYRPSFLTRLKSTYLSRSFITFVFCGGIGTLVNFIFSLIFSLRIDPVIAYVAGYILSLFVAYALNAELIFRASLNVKAFARFCVSYIPNFIILFSFVFIFIKHLYWHKVPVYILAALFGLPLTYILIRLFAFKKGEKNG